MNADILPLCLQNTPKGEIADTDDPFLELEFGFR